MNDHAAHPDPSDSRPTRLLIVDDDEGIRTLLDVAVSLDPRFELAGLAATADETRTLLRSHHAEGTPVDVILLDVTLPDADGIELMADLRAHADGVLIALFTGWSDSETLTRARRAGADAIFPKDGDPRGLLDGIIELTSTPA